MGRLFGKDGLKGTGVSEITCELVMQVARATVEIISGKSKRKIKIVVGRDTRSSGDTLESAVCAGVCSAGADVVTLGQVPVPSVPLMTKKLRADAGIMISYSYRRSDYNGIKIYSSDGWRISEQEEEAIEKLVLDEPWSLYPIKRREYGSITHFTTACEEYSEYVRSKVKTNLSGLRVAIDCGNGTPALTAKSIFEGLGAEIVMMGDKPDGTNINKDCGSMVIESMMAFVRENSCDCGIAFDGGGERCLAVDENGQLIDGDMIIAICAKSLKEMDKLSNNTLVVTPANNLGLTHFGYDRYMDVANCGSDERKLIKKLKEGHFSIGGNPTGSIIFADDSTSPDGQLTGARLLEALRMSERKMSELTVYLKKLPQVMINIPIDRRYSKIWKEDIELAEVIKQCQAELGNEGRIIVRETGKEPAIRVLAEGCDFTQINEIAVRVGDMIRLKCSAFETGGE